MPPLARIAAVRAGLPVALAADLATAMAVSNEWLYQVLDFSRATMHRKARANQPLSRSEGERALGLMQLIDRVDRIVRDSGEPAGFSAAEWTARWLDQPNPALGGEPPRMLFDTAEGRELLMGLVEQMQSGAYA